MRAQRAALRARRASRYSTPKLLLGPWRQRAASPRRAVAACCRATGKERPSAAPGAALPARQGRPGSPLRPARGAAPPLRWPKAQGVHHPGGGEQAHPAPGKGFCRGHRPRGGQLQHQVHPLPEGQGCSGPLVCQGGLPPLDPVAAHGTDHGAVRAKGLAHRLDVVPVAAVEGVIFRDDADCTHGPTTPRKILKFGKNSCPFPQNGLIYSCMNYFTP